jgi:hypothetical protein
VDTAASTLAGGSIPRAVRWPCIALGAGSTATGVLLARELGESA